MNLNSKAEKIFNIFENIIPEYYHSETIRKSQVQMAIDISAFLDKNESKRIMFIEAPVGTGKSLGALIPSMIESKIEKNCRVVYATATINLQGQLMNSEVPLLKELSLIKQPILAKGKAHYYCHREFNYKKNKFTPKERELFFDFFKKAETGQRNELEDNFIIDLSEQKWSKVALNASKKECERCEFSRICPTNNHRLNFMSKWNDLVITNHDQLVRSVLNLQSEPIQSPLIPINPGVIIIDEAHHFLENFLNQFEQSFTLSKLRNLKRLVSNKHTKRYVQLINQMETIINKQIRLIEGSLQGRYRVSENLLDIIEELYDIVDDSLVEESTNRINGFYTWYDNYESSDLEELSNLLKNILDKKFVSWINYDEKKFSMISETFPSDFKRALDFLLQYNKIIVMSGTLTTNGDFEPLINQWRLKKNDVITKKLDTPFDYGNQAIVYVPKNMGSPESMDYLEKCTEKIQELISLTNGRSLILTTAKEHMNYISDNLLSYLKELEINLYVQDQSGVEKLTKQFKEDETSVLVGSGSFFSGFSVPGKSLISVILTKLPFPIHDDPFLKLIGQGYEDDFLNLILFPNMINKLNQAAGRLIRDINDFGIFTILDTRIFTRNYGSKVQRELKSQGFHITRSFEEVVTFIDRKLKFGAETRYQSYKREEINVKDYLWEKPVIENPVIIKNKKVEKKVENHHIKVTQEQEGFAKEICEQYNLKLPTRSKLKSPDTLYKYLVESLYYNFEDTSIIENEFPFNNEVERKRLLKIKGSERKTIKLPKCTQFGCNGECKEGIKNEIRRFLQEDYNAKDVKFYHNTSRLYCTVSVDPLEIIAKHFNSNE